MKRKKQQGSDNDLKDGWNEAFTSIFSRKSDEHSSRLFAYLQKKLREFRMERRYQVREILVEVYERGLKAAEKGEKIENPVAWSKRVGYIVIMELRRELNKRSYIPLDESDSPQVQYSDSFVSCLSEEEIKENIEILKEALSLLSTRDRDLLKLRTVQRMGWKDIRQNLMGRWKEVPNEGALRTAHHRAVKHLRKAFFAIREKLKASL